MEELSLMVSQPRVVVDTREGEPGPSHDPSVPPPPPSKASPGTAAGTSNDPNLFHLRDWGMLPDVTAAMIASYLLPWERGHMAMSCANWHRAIMESPHLWRTRDFRIHGNWRDSFHISYVKSVGRFLKRVYFTFGFRAHRRPRRLQKLFTGILAELYRQGPVQLKELSITELSFQRHFQSSDTNRAREGVMRSLNRYLRRQSMLEKLDVSDSGLRIDEGVGLLLSVSEHSSTSLRSLFIEDMFQMGATVHSEPRFAVTLSRFTRLVDISMNYSCFSAEVLTHLARSCRSTLELLTISTNRQDKHEHTIDRTAWVGFSEAMPRTRVKVIMSGIMRMGAVYRILGPGMPLQSVRMYGYNDGGFRPDRALRHISRNFQHIVEKISVDVGPVYHSYNRGFLSLVQACTALKSLEIHGRIQWPALRDVFDFVDESFIKKGLRPSLTYLRVVITMIGFGQEEALVMEEFRPTFVQHNLNYELVFDPMYPMPLGPVPIDDPQQEEDELIALVW
ncbi:uncharacterized protein LOC117290111 [Asterias rubens]|uniref:uncharacterized protein LOC117290111 n=1 Tax=Asterias rubens TaxID=7604 RepID=UPI0014559981|nr:uncharacterized protein LOC117290111 [Asterias rubens]